MFGCNPSCAPAAPLAGSWHHRRQIFQPFQKGVFLPQLDFIYDSGAGGSWGGQEPGWDRSRREEQSQGDVLEVNPDIPAGAEAGKGKIPAQNRVLGVFVGTHPSTFWMDFPRSYPKEH